MTNDYKGVIIPMLTPFDENEALDTSKLRWLTHHLIECGVHGLFPSGSTGEFFSLAVEEKTRILDIVVEETAGRIPVYAGAGGVSTQEALKLTRTAEAHGADGVCVITPFYLYPSAEELYQHYATIAKSTKLPVLAYNNPGRTGGVSLPVEVVARLAEIENFVGVKDSSGDIGLTAQYVLNTPSDFAVFQGRDDIFYPSFTIGTVGVVAATGNLVPKLVVELYEAFEAGDWQRSLDAQRRLISIRRAFGLGTFPAALKEAMALLGMSVGPARSPVKPLSEASRAQLRAVLVDIELLQP